MADNYTVERIDTLYFDTAIIAMDSAIKLFQNARTNIINITDPVMETWEGEGALAFDKVYKKLKTELKDEETNLITIRSNLQSIKESYEGWDNDLKNNYMNNSQ